jgi:predicted metal-dependent HD superfamily phosphohydrolase
MYIRLQAVIDDTLQQIGVSTERRQHIVDAYVEPWRTYHNAGHILRMIDALDCHDIPEFRSDIVYMIIYHDVWYKMGRTAGENEHHSAQWMCNDIANSIAHHALERVEQGILATICHTLDTVAPQHRECVGIFLDLDLMGLGQDNATFTQHTEEIWREWEPLYTRREFDRNSAQWAKNFLDRPRIYHSTYYTHLEDQARKNLETLM